MKYGVIGTGWIAEEFVKGANLTGKMELAAVYSRTEEKGREFADKFGCKTVVTSLESFAKLNDFTSVYIASPNALHYEQSRLMLENGKNVICEKPITVTPEQLEELQQLADEKKLIYTEAMMMAFNSVSEKIAEAIKKIGKIRTAHFDFTQYSSKYQALINGQLPNIFNPKMATGSLMDLGCYCVYAARYFFGNPQSIYACSQFLETGADCSTTAVLHYKNMDLTVTCSKVGQDYCGSQIIGDLGTIKIESISKLWNAEVFYTDGKTAKLSGEPEKSVLMSYEADGFYNFVNSFEVYEKKYTLLKNISLDVCKIIDEIRKQSGICFK